MADALHPIQLAARLSGLTPYVIRIWEHRYHAVRPRRSPSKRRLYSREDIERLTLLRELTQAGHSIGQVARLPNTRLRALSSAPAPGPPEAGPTPAPTRGPDLLGRSLEAVRAFDRAALETALQEGVARHGAHGVLRQLIGPLAQALGEGWRDGQITAAQEHFATGLLRDFLGGLTRPYGNARTGPTLITGTPAGQLHELGALLAGALAANLGWRVIHLGPSLPAEEIAGAARQQGARAVALSLVYPDDDPQLPGELRRLRAALPPDTILAAGGRAVAAYREALEGVGGVVIADLTDLGLKLDHWRGAARQHPA